MTPPAPADGRRVPRPLALPGTVWLLLLFVVPFGFVVAASVGSTDAVGRILYGWSTANYELAFDGVILPIVWRSVSYAAIATAVCLVVGYPTAYVIARYGGRWRTALVLAVLVPWLVSYIIRIYAWQQLLADGGLANALLREVGLGTTDFGCWVRRVRSSPDWSTTTCPWRSCRCTPPSTASIRVCSRPVETCTGPAARSSGTSRFPRPARVWRSRLAWCSCCPSATGPPHRCWAVPTST